MWNDDGHILSLDSKNEDATQKWDKAVVEWGQEKSVDTVGRDQRASTTKIDTSAQKLDSRSRKRKGNDRGQEQKDKKRKKTHGRHLSEEEEKAWKELELSILGSPQKTDQCNAKLQELEVDGSG